MVRRTLLVALSFASFVILAPTFVEADPTISAPSLTVGVGDTFTIPISITGATDLTSWQFDLAFDPTILTANSVTEGPFMSAFGNTLFIPGVIDNGTGLISLVSNLYVDVTPNPLGNGVLANIEFFAVDLGVSQLTFANAFLTDNGQVLYSESGGFVVQNGQSTAIPEPTTLMLLASGLALLGMRRLAKRRRLDYLGFSEARMTGHLTHEP